MAILGFNGLGPLGGGTPVAEGMYSSWDAPSSPTIPMLRVPVPAGTLSQFRVHIHENTSTTTTTYFRLKVNGSPVVSIAVPPGSTGPFLASGSFPVSAGDLVSVEADVTGLVGEERVGFSGSVRFDPA